MATLAEFKLLNILESRDQANIALKSGVNMIDHFIKNVRSDPMKQVLGLYAFEMEYHLKLPKDQLLARHQSIYKASTGVRVMHTFSSIDPKDNDFKSYFPEIEFKVSDTRLKLWLEKK
jgi:hypothetical protein